MIGPSAIEIVMRDGAIVAPITSSRCLTQFIGGLSECYFDTEAVSQISDSLNH
jgi:hypothetical protein